MPALSPRGGSTGRRAADGYELNFENTPVATVAKVILGDIMGTGYSIDPRIQGTITLLFRQAGAEIGHAVRVETRCGFPAWLC